MTVLQNKIDFAVILRVKNANPNGDPLNGNRPRTNYENFGEMTDVCIKRKIRDRLVERFMKLKKEGQPTKGQAVFVQADDRKIDDAKSLRDRAENALGKELGSAKTVELACAEWIDVRAFGQLFALKSNKKAGKKKEDGSDDEGDTGISIGIRGPVSVQSAFSVAPIDITSTPITKSTSNEGDGINRQSDQMGMKHRVDQGVYVFYGSMNPQLAESTTKFSEEDAEAIKLVLPKLFENDVSSARQDGSMEVLKVVWWKHNCKSGQHSSAKVHRTLRETIQPDGSFELAELEGLKPEIIEGF